MTDDRCDVLIVGGGPAGSSCARGLAGQGLDVRVLDRAEFPRSKICAGWVTPQVMQALDIDPEHYGRDHVCQPITGFRVGMIGQRITAVDCDETVSFGIRRCEFDDYLLRRSGARLHLGRRLESLEPVEDGWLVNREITARVLVGAGGHFCPVARRIVPAPRPPESAVAAQEVEFHLDPEQLAHGPAEGARPELYFTDDLKGYGWVVRKGEWLNVGLGRQDPRGFPAALRAFLDYLETEGRLPPRASRRFKGHAYLLYEWAPRPLQRDGALLVGDAAGLAFLRSGEGIRPAVESGLLAAKAILAARGDGRQAGRLYRRAMEERFGPRRSTPPRAWTQLLPRPWRAPLAGRLLAHPLFARKMLIDRWFLARHLPPLR
ncbi:MAG: NAD(P)/FAD-dependent oxidoreductase [Acidobacteriota bacterium]|nr:NAD(P)/FAD-dependent oxidoreductase [Acidobacteriota bacterium]